ncbi:MAG: rhomboid family intramembrane serine protease [Saprospiraceae bacterium]|nr:rhomboid family intramembrane serine protease [Saprospiraceae bacterium]
MQETSTIGFIIILATTLFSYQGLKDHAFLEKYSFQIDKILINKEYRRMLSSGFLHVSWMHLIFNMATLYFFSDALEFKLGLSNFILLYFGSLLGGSLFSLYIHRNHSDYSAIGASGAVSGLIFAAIALFPGIELSLLILPIYIPGWAYGLLYVLVSIYGIRSQSDNIGHDAHLGGGLVGLTIALVLFPDSIKHNYLPILLIVVPSAIFIYLILTRPGFLLINPTPGKQKGFYLPEDKYNAAVRDNRNEIDKILDKIKKQGIDSLTKQEIQKLKEDTERKRRQ